MCVCRIQVYAGRGLGPRHVTLSTNYLSPESRSSRVLGAAEAPVVRLVMSLAEAVSTSAPRRYDHGARVSERGKQARGCVGRESVLLPFDSVHVHY